MRHPLVTDRRDLLRLATAAAALAWLPRGAHAQARWTHTPFALGVASGAPAADSIVLWTRLAPERGGLPNGGRDPLPVRWELAEDEAFTRIVRDGETLALPELGHSVHVEAGGLQPNQSWYYRFHSGDATSPTGRTRTLPAADGRAERLRVAYASCQRWEHGRYAAWRHMREDAPDLVMFLGDYIYEYPNIAAAIRSFPTIGWVHTLREYRERYELHRSDPDLQAMHASCPWLVTWDDHEVQNDYAGLRAGDPRPLGMNAVADFAARRAAAYQAFYEHMPIRAGEFARVVAAGTSAPELRIYTRYRWGKLADLLLLDARQYRDAQACPPKGHPGGAIDPATCAALADPTRTLLGEAQEQWLDATLGDAKGTWTVLGQQSLFGQRDFLSGPGQLVSSDGWDGYPLARRRLTDTLKRRQVANPVLLGGNEHENWVGHVLEDYARPDSARVGVEFCGTSITSHPGSADRLPGRLAESPHFVFADAAHRGYGLVDFSPRSLSATLRGLDDAQRPDATVSTLARFTVEAGRPVLERA